MMNELAVLADLPPQAQNTYYQRVRNESIGLGVDQADLPPTYTPYVASLAQQAKAHLGIGGITGIGKPTGATQRALLIANLKQSGDHPELLATLQQQQAADLKRSQVLATPGEEAFAKETSKANAKYFSDVGEKSASAQQIYNDNKIIQGIGGQIPQELGVISGHVVRFSPKGIAYLKATNSLVVDKFNDMKHTGRGGLVFLKTLLASKPSALMPIETVRYITNGNMTVTGRQIQQNDFNSFLKDNGFVDQAKIRSMWAAYNRAYPMFNNKGDPQLQNVGQWRAFLQNNPSVLPKKLRGQLDFTPPPPLVGPGGVPASQAGSGVVPVGATSGGASPQTVIGPDGKQYTQAQVNAMLAERGVQ